MPNTNNPYLNTLYKSIEDVNKVKLSISDRVKIANIVRSVDSSLFQKYNSKEALTILVEYISNQLFKKTNKESLISNNKQIPISYKESFTSEDLNAYQQENISEVDYTVPNYVDELKQGDVSIMHILGMTSMYQIQRLLNPDSMLERHYICLDSRYRIGANSESFTSQSWNYAATNNKRDGFVTTQNEIKNIRGIRLYQIRIPWDTDGSTFPQMRCMSILFHEFANQAMISHTQRRFHFLPQMIWSETVITGMELQLESEIDYMYRFQTPILSFTSLTYSFGNPYTLMTIYHDRDTCTFTYSTYYLYIVCSKAHLFNNPTWVTITGFTTASPLTQSLFIDGVNSPYGQYATVHNATTLRLGAYFPTSAITIQVGLTANVYFDRRRIFMPLEFICLKD